MDDLNPTEICAAKKNKPWIGGGMISPSANAVPDGYSTLTWTLADEPEGTSVDSSDGTVTAGTEGGTGYIKVSNQHNCFDSRPFTVVKVEFPDTKPVLLEAATDTEWTSKEFGATQDVPIDVAPTGRTLKWELSTAELVREVGPPAETYPVQVTSDATGHSVLIGSTNATGKAELKATDLALACGDTKDVYVLKLDILQVPQYLFASAKYATPVKFEVVGADAANTCELQAVRIKFYGDGTEEEHSDNQRFSLSNPLVRTAAAVGPRLVTLASAPRNANVFETFIDSTLFSSNLTPKPYSRNSRFELEVDVRIDGARTITLESDPQDEQSKVRQFADTRIFAIDMTVMDDSNGGATGFRIVTDSRARETVQPTTQTLYKAAPDGGYWANPSVNEPRDGIPPDVDWQGNGYLWWHNGGADNAWPSPQQPRWERYRAISNISWFRNPNDPSGECFSNVRIMGDADRQVLYSTAIMREPIMREPIRTRSYGKYLAETIGCRVGAYFLVSYGPKAIPGITDTTIMPSAVDDESGYPQTEYAMDLDRPAGTTNLQVCKGRWNGKAVATAGTTIDVEGMALGIGWATGGPLTAPIIGTASAIYDHCHDDYDEQLTAGNRRAFGSIGVWGKIIEPNGAPDDGWTDAEYIDSLEVNDTTSHPRPRRARTVGTQGDAGVGAQIAAYVQLDAGAHLEAKHTDSSTVPTANRCEVFVRYGRTTPRNQIRIKCYFPRFLKDIHNAVSP